MKLQKLDLDIGGFVDWHDVDRKTLRIVTSQGVIEISDQEHGIQIRAPESPVLIEPAASNTIYIRMNT